MSLPLEDLRVLDLSRLLPGPFCSLLLADCGADVVKVEDTGMGDYARWSPPFHEGVEKSAGGALFLALNRNKRYIRGLVAPKLDMKFVPEIRYRVDTALDYANKIDEILRSPEVARDLDKK